MELKADMKANSTFELIRKWVWGDHPSNICDIGRELRDRGVDTTALKEDIHKTIRKHLNKDRVSAYRKE